MRSYFDYFQGRCTRGSVYYLAFKLGWQFSHKAHTSGDIKGKYIQGNEYLFLHLNPAVHFLLSSLL
jgi:hypothetical protein